MKCGEKIRYYREALGLSQTDLAKRLGYSGRSAISHIESGERELTSTKLKMFAHALGVPPTELLDDRNPVVVIQSIDPERKRMISIIEHLPADQLQTYRTLLEMPIERLRAVVDLLTR